MRIEYSQLDARLRWYGPELVLRDVRVLDRDGSQALFATRRAASRSTSGIFSARDSSSPDGCALSRRA